MKNKSDEKRESWIDWINETTKEFQNIRLKKYFFEVYLSAAQKSKNQELSDFYLWCTINYYESLIIRLRRLTEDDKKKRSFITLLRDIEKDVDLIWIEWFTKKYGEGFRDYFLDLTNGKTKITKEQVKKDIESLQPIMEKTNNFFNTYIMHLSKTEAIKNVSSRKFKEIEDLINNLISQMEILILKYLYLLTANALQDLEILYPFNLGKALDKAFKMEK